jgi:hypothetical protein
MSPSGVPKDIVGSSVVDQGALIADAEDAAKGVKA